MKLLHLPLFLLFPLFSLIFSNLSASATNSLIYAGCSQLRFNSGTPYESNVNSLLTSLLNSATASTFKTTAETNVVYGLFQCEGDLSNSDCKDCVTSSVTQLRTICPQATGGVIQIEGCFLKYDNATFFGVVDKTESLKRCGPSVGYNSDALNRRDAALGYLTAANGEYFRGGGSGSVGGVAQCVQDLTVSECQDCLDEASARLRSECETSTWGDMFLGKCYIRYVDREHHSRSTGKRLLHHRLRRCMVDSLRVLNNNIIACMQMMKMWIKLWHSQLES